MVLKREKGITLVALVITIIVLLILAGVTINFTIGQNGILEKATIAKNDTNRAKIEEEFALLVTEYNLGENQKSFEEFIQTKDPDATFSDNGNTVTYQGVEIELDKDSLKDNGEATYETEEFETKTYEETITSSPYVLSKYVEKTLLTYGECDITLEKLKVKVEIGNSGAEYESAITAGVYGNKNGEWVLLKEYNAERHRKTSSAVVADETINFSNAEKYTNFEVKAYSTDHEIYGKVELTPIGY